MAGFSSTKTITLSPKEIFVWISENLSPPGSFKRGYRGVRNSDWNLAPSLRRYTDEVIRSSPHLQYTIYLEYSIRDRLLKEFKKNIVTQGLLSPDEADRMDLWQIGRHYGLPCPLLDWSQSPYVALYFSLIEVQTHDEDANGTARCIWILDRDILGRTNTNISRDLFPKHHHEITGEQSRREKIPTLDEIEPEPTYKNRRLFAQQGFFTFHTHAESIDEWWDSQEVYQPEESEQRTLLTKILVRPSIMQRLEMLDRLNDMNINHLTLFPDIEGAVGSCQQEVMQNLRRLHPRTT